MLPSLLVDEIFQFLDNRSLLALRRVSRDFNRTAVPLLLRFHSAKNFSCPGYQGFVARYGGFVRVLEMHGTGFECFRENGAPLAAVFPNLRYISLFWTGFRLQPQVDAFAEECLRLARLKRIAIHQEWRDTAYIPDSVKERTRTLCAKSVPLAKLNVCFLWNAVDDFMLKYPPFLERCKQDAVSSLVVYGDYQYEFSMTLGPKEQACPADSLETFKQLSAHVDHCMVHYKVDEDDSAEYLLNFTHMASLDLDLVAHGSALGLGQQEFVATRLSLKVCPSEVLDFLAWSHACFPNLQHLHLNTPVPSHHPPLPPNCFRALEHFYTTATHPVPFWHELAAAAPRLRYIHAADPLPVELPLVQACPYRNILGIPSDKYYFFTHHL